MQDEMFQEVLRQLRNSQDKYTYFILAAAGTAIALAVKQTQGSTISYYQIPLACAVLCWGLSFFFGYRYLAYVNSNLYLNLELFRVKNGQHKDIGSDPKLQDFAIRVMREIFEDNSNKANCLSHCQFRFLIAGALFYIAWHILEMWLRS